MKRRLVFWSFVSAIAGIGCSLVVSYDGYGDGVRADGGGGTDGTIVGDGSGSGDGSTTDDGSGGNDASDAGGDAFDAAVDAGPKRYALVVLGGRVYNDAGSTTTTASVEYAMINPDGTLGAWKLGPPLPSPEDAVGATGWASSVFVNDDFGGAAAVMQPDGGLSGWAGTSSVNRNNPRLVAVDGRIYLASGDVANTEVPEVYYATITGAQTHTAWTATSPLPADGGPRSDTILLSAGRKIYAVGGEYKNTDVSSVLVTTIDNTGALGAWTEIGPLPVAGDSIRGVVVQNHITLLGGSYDPIGDRTMHTSEILDGGALGPWQSAGSHTPLVDAPLHAVHGNFVYLIGGTISTAVDTTSVSYASVSVAGVPNTWQTTSALNVARHNGTAVVVEVP
jgi:hypothetical protein